MATNLLAYQSFVRLSAVGALAMALLSCEKSHSDHPAQTDLMPPAVQPVSDTRYSVFIARLADFDTLSIDAPRFLNVVDEGWRELQHISLADSLNARRLHLRMFLRLLASIEQRQADREFNFAERLPLRADAALNAYPRPPLGISRDPIRDLTTPTDSELAVRNNHRFDVQVELGRMRDRVMLDLAQLLKDGSSAPNAWRDLKEATAVADIGEKTRNQITSMVHYSAAQNAMNSKYELLVEHLDVVSLNISVEPPGFPEKDPGGLISALFYTSARGGPDERIIRSDGSYPADGARLSKENMLRALEVLDRNGFLASAATYYSDRTINPKGPPPAAQQITTYFAARPKSPLAEISLSFFDENYYTNYIILPVWDTQLIPLLTELRRAISDSAAKALLTQLSNTSTGPLRVRVAPGATLNTTDARVDVTFTNTGKEPIRILNEFDAAPLPAFLGFSVRPRDGAPLQIPGVAKVDFPGGSLRYVELGKDKQFTVTVRLDEVLPADILPGEYSISAWYHNQYGKDCFQGQSFSNEITITLRRK